MTRALRLLPLSLILASLVSPVIADTVEDGAGDVEYGAYLAQECSACHHIHVTKPGIPHIVGLTTDYFIETLNLYKEGARDNTTMQTIARSLDDEQIAALAAFFAQEERQP